LQPPGLALEAALVRKDSNGALGGFDVIMLKFYAYLSAVVLFLTIGRAVWRRPAKSIDWELIVAFIRLEFPPHERDAAQKLAAGLAEILGLKVKQLRPEHTLKQIADMADERIHAKDLIKVLHAAYGVHCRPETSFRSLVESIVARESRRGDRA
jgi:hypothetical protein